MGKFASSYIKIAETEFKKVGKNNTPLLELKLMEPIRKKDDDGQWKTTGHNFFDGAIWGDKAVESTLDLEEGTVLDLSPEIKDGDNGQWVSHKAELRDESWQYEGKEYHRAKIVIYDFEIRD